MSRSSVQANEVRRKAEKFRAWLTTNGAAVQEPTNKWELIRFWAGDELSIVYCNAEGGTKFTGASEAAWMAYKNGKAWRAAKATKLKAAGAEIFTLFKRDGDLCFFSQEPVDLHNVTVEHLVARTHQGPNHISNKFLAHRPCNHQAGHLSAPEKIKIHTAAVIRKREQLTYSGPAAPLVIQPVTIGET